MSELEPSNLNHLKRDAIHVFRQGGGSRPDVLLIAQNGQRVVLKDHNACDRLFAIVLGRLLAHRETRALQKLDNLSGVPRLLKRVDARAILVEYHDAQPAVVKSTSTNWRTFFADLAELIAQMHSLGVAHCDLRSPQNILIDQHGRPVLVDFVACVFRGRRYNPVAAWMFNQFCKVDESAIIKLKHKLAPELLSESEIHVKGNESLPARVVRGFGVGVRNASRWMFTRHRE